jgi:phosphinothricin acetyltransferase
MSPTIRAASPDDAAAIAAIYSPFVSDSAVSFELEPPEPVEMARRIQEGQQRFPWLVATEGGEVVGYAYATDFRSRPAYRRSAEASLYIAEGSRGRGLGRRLLGTILDDLEERGIVTVIGGLTLPNPASEALFLSAGFEHVGVFRSVGFKFGKWHDVAFYQRTLPTEG